MNAERRDLSAQRPWTAKDGGSSLPGRAWAVYAANSIPIALYLSAEDAKLIAAAPKLLAVLQEIAAGAEVEHVRQAVHEALKEATP